MTTDAWGVDDQFVDALGTRRATSDATRSAIHRAMGVETDAERQHPPVRVATQGTRLRLGEPGEIELEAGGRLAVEDELLADLPLGYHQFCPRRGAPVRLIVAPTRCHLPPDLRTWGWAVQLYAARSRQSWGIGDLGDLALVGRSARAMGAGLLVTNPLCAASPGLPQEASPYFPSSRRYRNPLYLRIEDVPGFAERADELRPLAAEAQALNAERLIDRQRIYPLKMRALEALWGAFGSDPRFDQYCADEGAGLGELAAFCVLAEVLGSDWRRWDARFSHPEHPAVRQYVAEHDARFRFFQWLQWLLDVQLARAAGELPLMQDLPIGADPGGADAWAWQDLLAQGATVGAPPDLFNTQGQNWGLPPFVPHKLRAAGYQPFIDIVRAAMRHAAGLRIDHVLGLFRLYWIPAGVDPRHGAYVRYPAADLLDIVALESVRAGAIVVGEDLGTVEAGVRQQLADHDVLSYAVVWFESATPASYARKALAAVTTHDLPTVAGLWTGSDLAEQQHLALAPNIEGQSRMRQHLSAVGKLAAGASVDEAIGAVHRALATAPATVLLATLEDALAVEERPNMPNTTSAERPNWSLALPTPIEDLPQVARAHEIARSLSAR